MMRILFFFCLGGSYSCMLLAQLPTNPVYVDAGGIIRFTQNKHEASFFGVNYTVPFAYGYRSHKALQVDIEKAIDADVYHMSRLGLNAFRVHVWDVEISDSLGNLIENEHLRLFDYLLQKLKEKRIKILLTPIAFWGNGYPEIDKKTNGFSTVYTKTGAVVNEQAFQAQENYLKQFFQHTNPYTNLTYQDDPDVIAMEINNEPQHSGPRSRTTEYINRMAAAVRSTGWTKPIFYNISESPTYAGAVTAAKVDGFSFQWYPTGLVANRELKGNFLPNVDAYRIPFMDSLPAFTHKARMVYEFDAGDLLQPILYPAMARSFRTAGFQWATQFAYDPMATADVNTEYQTHYLNMAYTPAKAISLLIASRVFQRVPRGKTYGVYPTDTTFDVFHISYRQQLSEMNSDNEYYYSNSTTTPPRNKSTLQHVAGVGSSPLVSYKGTGAYFLDRLSASSWRLELMPDAITISDPFVKASPHKVVTRIEWRQRSMHITLPGLERNFWITNGQNRHPYKMQANGNHFLIEPGVYILSTNEAHSNLAFDTSFYAPLPIKADPFVRHQPLSTVSPNRPFSIFASITGIDSTATVQVEFRHSANRWKTIAMTHRGGFAYEANVPVEMISPGLLQYRIIVSLLNGEMHTFPGGFKGNPYAWDEYRSETWQTRVAAPESRLLLFNPEKDRDKLMVFNPDWRHIQFGYATAGEASDLVLQIALQDSITMASAGFQLYCGDNLQSRRNELSSFTRLVLKARASEARPVNIGLITTGAAAFSAPVQLTEEWTEFSIPLKSLQPDSFWLLPRPYPGFLPLFFRSTNPDILNLSEVEKVELRITSMAKPATIQIASVSVVR